MKDMGSWKNEIICNKTWWNRIRKNRIIANLSESLNKKGMNQAINVGEKLRKLDLDIIYCSSIERAKHTLKLFDLDSSIPVLIEDRLKEKDMGIYENISFDNLDWNVFLF